MTVRTILRPTDSLREAVVKMSLGNPGAINAMMQLIQRDQLQGQLAIISLDDLGIRGPGIWVAYKDYCGCDAAKLTTAALEGDEGLVEAVRAQDCLDRYEP